MSLTRELRLLAPARWRLAGWLGSRLPDVRGRDRLVSWVRGANSYDGPMRGWLTNGASFSFPSSSDGSIRSMVSLQYRSPALAPILEAALQPGDCFYDVGVNLGLYSMWASRLVGPSGEVHAFEPVPATLDLLAALVRENDASNVVIRPTGRGCSRGTGHDPECRQRIWAATRRTGGAQRDYVRDDTLDEYTIDHRSPQAVLNNLHPSEIEGVNCWLFEAAGCGAAVLCEHRPVLSDLFDTGREIAPFATVDELVEKAGKLLANADGARSIGDAASRKAHTRHTYRHRFMQLLGVVT